MCTTPNMLHIIWAYSREILSWVVCEQQRRRPACALAIRLLESIISLLSSSEISIFQLVCVDEETGLKLALLETLKARFSREEAHLLISLLSSFYLNYLQDSFLFASRMENSVDPDQLALHFFFIQGSTWTQERIGISC